MTLVELMKGHQRTPNVFAPLIASINDKKTGSVINVEYLLAVLPAFLLVNFVEDIRFTAMGDSANVDRDILSKSDLYTVMRVHHDLITHWETCDDCRANHIAIYARVCQNVKTALLFLMIDCLSKLIDLPYIAI